LSQDGNSFIVFWEEQNIRLHTRPGLDQSREAGAADLTRLAAGRECPRHFMYDRGTVLGILG